VFLLAASATAWAQGPAAPPAQPQTMFVSTRNPMIDGGIFAILAGGAIYAAVRPSSRV
jgi:hypothetical protein